MPEIAQVEIASRFILRGAAAAGRTMLGLTIPALPCRSAVAGPCAALWLGPDEWLVLDGDGAAIAAALNDVPHALVDISHRQLAFRVSGRDADQLLNGAVPLDLSEAAFPTGMCTRTLFEKAEIALWRRGEREWHLEVARSFAPYVCELVGAIVTANGLALG
jgi:sarcosine oxidase subunit gamma